MITTKPNRKFPLPVCFGPTLPPLVTFYHTLTLLARQGSAVLLRSHDPDLPTRPAVRYWTMVLRTAPGIPSDNRGPYRTEVKHLEARLRGCTGVGTSNEFNAVDSFACFVHGQRKGPPLALYGDFRFPAVGSAPEWEWLAFSLRCFPKEAFSSGGSALPCPMAHRGWHFWRA